MTVTTRLVIGMLLLLLASQAAISVSALSHYRSQLIEEAQTRLQKAAQLVGREIDHEERQLRAQAQQGDPLEEFPGNDIVLTLDPQGTISTSTLAALAPGTTFPYTALWQRATAEGSASAIVQTPGDHLYLLRLTPESGGPHWRVLGSPIEQAFIDRLSTLNDMDITLLTLDDAGVKHVLFSTLSDESSALDEPLNITQVLPIGYSTNAQVQAALSVSREDVLAPFRFMKYRLAAMFAVALSLAMMISWATVRTLGYPIQRLNDVARQISEGQYRPTERPLPKGGDLGALTQTLYMMQEKLDQRASQLLHRSRQDHLTGLPNRQSAEAKVEQLIEENIPFTLNRFCINDFKRINDTFGYLNGDKVLIEIGNRLRDLAAERGYTYRIGADEYLWLYPCSSMDKPCLRSLGNALTKSPVLSDISPTFVTVSVGQSCYPRHGAAPDALLRRADIALNQAKHLSSHFQVYQSGMDEKHLRQLRILKDMSAALENDELYMVYQPKINMRTGRLAGVEALVRWEHTSLGFIAPDEFIELAERAGTIGALTQWVIGRVSRQIADWRKQGFQTNVAINLSAMDLLDKNLPNKFLQAFEDNCLIPGTVSVEITESALMQDPLEAKLILERLRQFGLEIAIDDFGTGYSSLSQLRHMPIDQLKIDKSFILNLNTQFEDVMIVRSIIDLGHNLGLSVTAEGVENEASLSMLSAMECEIAQGYFFARPLKCNDLIEWVERFERTPLVIPKSTLAGCSGCPDRPGAPSMYSRRST
ncbi:putative bifunctional diguanylate cyclase/phosphodiesterase [Larsenimonas suaedae]|uniref:EAL domain-containing protein n=1 Tax=Larsenimonas suaedae TaxID=1851019 RepID=A0ABU1GTJ8_9GAMM|nr:GGDEF domain-containing phosphodiesterase [Larsenimonas suaedae]MCM2971809.1 EAL domain-containing protein [Larsenimonas suaedae]MDR5895361.1 EAL domain-containing protein [Larsenimonas suaedae]